MFENIEITLVPIIVGLVQIIKIVGVSDRFAPLVSLFFGISLMVAYGYELQPAIVQGIIAGLSASGLWSGGKTILNR